MQTAVFMQTAVLKKSNGDDANNSNVSYSLNLRNTDPASADLRDDSTENSGERFNLESIDNSLTASDVAGVVEQGEQTDFAQNNVAQNNISQNNFAIDSVVRAAVSSVNPVQDGSSHDGSGIVSDDSVTDVVSSLKRIRAFEIVDDKHLASETPLSREISQELFKEQIEVICAEKENKLREVSELKSQIADYSGHFVANPEKAVEYVNYIAGLSKAVIEEKHNHLFDETAKAEFVDHLKDTLQNNPHMVGVLKVYEERDSRVLSHVLGTAAVSAIITKEMGYDELKRQNVTKGALGHDIAKGVGYINRAINQARKPTDEEWMDIKEHPRVGAEVMDVIAPYETNHSHAVLRTCAVGHHVYHNNQHGYPDDAKYDLEKIAQTPIREKVAIVTVSDSYDTMMASRKERPYKEDNEAVPGLTAEQIKVKYAISELKEFSGTQFNPYVTNVLIGLHKPHYGASPQPSVAHSMNSVH
ncbi:MAG: HD domain-containing protein [Nanoarchaeota archaeon]|nr:HD domain-containing protein [Nanoarchaeota archaeon]